jgi:hypothetical protein
MACGAKLERGRLFAEPKTGEQVDLSTAIA